MKRTIQVMLGHDAMRVGTLHFDAVGARQHAAFAFSILVTNVDDHLHNHGFLHTNGGQWSLAPAFDINPFPERVRELKTWISEETGPEATIDSLMSVIAYFQIPIDRAQRILRETESAVSRWRDQGRAIGMTNGELDAFSEAFEHPERNAACQAMGHSH